jgi:hypothetical protein
MLSFSDALIYSLIDEHHKSKQLLVGIIKGNKTILVDISDAYIKKIYIMVRNNYWLELKMCFIFLIRIVLHLFLVLISAIF